ncbi:MAG: FAD-dependent oxidoreductase [Candidatus Woesearchaeota archaeon]
MKYEAIVIGCGPAGLSAAIYLGRAKVKTLLIGKSKESQLIKAHKIENYFGFPEGITGKDLLNKGIKQVKKFKVNVVENEVTDIDKIKEEFKVKLGNSQEHTAKVIIIATGTPIKLSGIKNEEQLTGKGLHYCVECDGAFYQKKKVAVIGNGNHAAESAIDLVTFTKDITIISNADNFNFSEEMKKQIKKHNIKLTNEKVSEFSGKKFLDTITLNNNKKLKVNGVFMACGTASALDFSSKLALNINQNILVVDKNNMTSIKGIFAAGNCSGRCRQVANNVGQGCNAGVNAIKYLRNKQVYFDYSR